MKSTTLIAFAVAVCASCLAGTVSDAGHLLGVQTSEVAAAVAPLPVWIETRVTVPGQGLKAYADAKVAQLPPRSFYVVITTQPREWRVSMNPAGLASPEAVRQAGERMVAGFRRGEFVPAVVALARELNGFVTAPESRPQAVTVRRSRPAVSQPKRAAPPETDAWVVQLWIVGAVVVVCIGLWIAWSIRNRATDDDSARRLRSTPPSLADAQRVFDSYSATERAALIARNRTNQYASGASTDPVVFWMLLWATQPEVLSESAGEAWLRSAATNSSDTFNSTTGFDTGASFSSGSSHSDSSGAGGSW